jgi:hypothetical protein
MQVDVNKVLAGKCERIAGRHTTCRKRLEGAVKQDTKALSLLKFFAPVFTSKFEEGGNANFRQISVMLDEFEQQVEIANYKIGITKTGKDIVK